MYKTMNEITSKDMHMVVWEGLETKLVLTCIRCIVGPCMQSLTQDYQAQSFVTQYIIAILRMWRLASQRYKYIVAEEWSER